MVLGLEQQNRCAYGAQQCIADLEKTNASLRKQLGEAARELLLQVHPLPSRLSEMVKAAAQGSALTGYLGQSWGPREQIGREEGREHRDDANSGSQQAEAEIQQRQWVRQAGRRLLTYVTGMHLRTRCCPEAARGIPGPKTERLCCLAPDDAKGQP